MVRSKRVYKGRYLDYFLECYAEPPYQRWLWRYGYQVFKRGRWQSLPLVDGLTERPNPRTIFPNLINSQQ